MELGVGPGALWSHFYILLMQVDWSSQDRDPTCPRCKSEAETFKHVVQCPAISGLRHTLDPKLFDIAPTSDLWKSNEKGMELIKRFSSFILKYRINFPAKGGFFPFTVHANLAS